MPKEDQNTEGFWDALTGILFVMLPLTVLVIVRFYQGSTLWGLLGSPEWSFGSAILFGQSIIKSIHATAKLRGNVMVERLKLLVAGLIVFGLVPSLVVLSLILIDSTPKNWLVILQILLFIIACLGFITTRCLEDISE